MQTRTSVSTVAISHAGSSMLGNRHEQWQLPIWTSAARVNDFAAPCHSSCPATQAAGLLRGQEPAPAGTQSRGFGGGTRSRCSTRLASSMPRDSETPGLLLKAPLPPGPCRGKLLGILPGWHTWETLLWPCSVQSQRKPTAQLMQYLLEASVPKRYIQSRSGALSLLEAKKRNTWLPLRP